MTDNLNYAIDASTPVVIARYDSSNTDTKTLTSCNVDGACSMNGNTRVGTGIHSNEWYYSWYAATGESGTSAQSNIEAEWSICPAGWKLPANYTISASKSYGSLTNAYNLTTNGINNNNTNTNVFEAFPLSFTRSGGYYSGNPLSIDNYGWYVSSTAGSNTIYAYNIAYGTSYTYPQGDSYKNLASPIRCVALQITD